MMFPSDVNVKLTWRSSLGWKQSECTWLDSGAQSGMSFSKSLMAGPALPLSAQSAWADLDLSVSYIKNECALVFSRHTGLVHRPECPLSTQRTDSDWSVKDLLRVERWAQGGIVSEECQDTNSSKTYISVSAAWHSLDMWLSLSLKLLFFSSISSSGLDLLFLFLLCSIFV